jgi:RNA polymerase-binding transcription factor
LDIERYKRRLLALEQQLVQRIGRQVTTALDTTDDQPAAGDRSLIDEIKEEYLSEADTDSAILKQVRAALIRIEDGTFGTCAVDGQPIEEKRLEAVPWTPYCLKHQQELEESAGIRTPSL